VQQALERRISRDLNAEDRQWPGIFPAILFWAAIEHVLEKLTDFSDKNMLQFFDFEHPFLARVIHPEPKML
jgi:hypothetical protein